MTRPAPGFSAHRADTVRLAAWITAVLVLCAVVSISAFVWISRP